MDFVSVRIITDNLDAMVEFYEKVTGFTADRPAPVFAELHYRSCTLALGHTSTTARFNNGPAQRTTRPPSSDLAGNSRTSAEIRACSLGDPSPAATSKAPSSFRSSPVACDS